MSVIGKKSCKTAFARMMFVRSSLARADVKVHDATPRPILPRLPSRSRLWPKAYVATVALFTATVPLLAATPDQAKAFSERAAAYIEKVGEEKAFADFSRPDGGFVDGELYVFCYDQNGVNKAHGGNPSFVGRSLLHIKDPDGAEPNAMIVKMGLEQGRGWVDFKWPNPVTKRIENKSAYVIRTHDVTCGAGYYRG
jgi:cytochrome c